MPKPLHTPASIASWSLAVLFLGLASVTHADPDLWGHLRFGLDILQTHALPATDPYSFTQDRAWVNHEWLSEVMMAAAYEGLGTIGVRFLKAAIVTSTLAIVWALYQDAAWPAKLGAIAWLIFGSVHMIATVRPQLWSFLFIALTARMLLAPNRQTYWILPLTFAMWANLHGGWVVGLGTLGLWVLFGGIVEEGRRTRTWVMAGACVLATLATPYGLMLWAFVWETVHLERGITEWRPLWEGASVSEWIAWAGTVALGAWTIGTGRRDLARAAVLMLLAVLALRVMRIGSLFTTVTIIFASTSMRWTWPLRSWAPAPRAPRTVAAALAVVSLAAAAIGAFRISATSACITSEGPWGADPVGITALRSAPPGRLVTAFDWGQYAIWHLGPRIRVSIDGRRETIYSPEHLALHDEVTMGTDAGLRTLAQWSPEYVWLPPTAAATRRWLEVNGYEIVVDSARSFLASKTPLVTSNQANGGPRCFPY